MLLHLRCLCEALQQVLLQLGQQGLAEVFWGSGLQHGAQMFRVEGFLACKCSNTYATSSQRLTARMPLERLVTIQDSVIRLAAKPADDCSRGSQLQCRLHGLTYSCRHAPLLQL